MPDSTNSTPQEKAPWYLTRTAVVWGLLLVGPLALPLLWYCRSFKKGAKITITVILAVLTYISIVYTPVLLEMLGRRLEELKAVAGGGG